MKQIKLTKDKYALVDNDDFETLKDYSWCANIKKSYGKPYYYAVRNIYPVDRKHPKAIYMHRLTAGAKENNLCLVVDHINHNTLDNRKENLRIVTRAENLANRGGN